MQIIVLDNQTIWDVAMQYTGKVSNGFPISVANNLVPTNKIAPGTILTIPEDLEKDEQIVNYYKVNDIQPATAYVDEVNSTETLGGIDNMKIEETFTVR